MFLLDQNFNLKYQSFTPSGFKEENLRKKGRKKIWVYGKYSVSLL